MVHTEYSFSDGNGSITLRYSAGGTDSSAVWEEMGGVVSWLGASMGESPGTDAGVDSEEGSEDGSEEGTELS